MKIETYAISYNEELMLPYFIRHYSKLGDIILYDNYSTDKTVQIANAAGIKVINYDSNNEIRDDIYLDIKNNCWKKSSADWVIICDVDEFLYHPDLIRCLSSTKGTIVTTTGYDMYSEKFPSTEGQIYEEVTMGMISSGYSKLMIFNPKKIKEIRYGPGCHTANPAGEIIFNNNTGIKILHMKYLSKEYVINRHKLYGKRLSQTNKDHKWGIHYTFPEELTTNNFNERIKICTKVV